jgi:hypothetical protein
MMATNGKKIRNISWLFRVFFKLIIYRLWIGDGGEGTRDSARDVWCECLLLWGGGTFSECVLTAPDMRGSYFSLVKSYSVTLIILPSERVCSTSTTLYKTKKQH